MNNIYSRLLMVIFILALQGCGLFIMSSADKEQVRLEKEMSQERLRLQKVKEKEDGAELRRLEKEIKRTKRKKEEFRQRRYNVARKKLSEIEYKIRSNRVKTARERKHLESDLLKGIKAFYADGVNLFQSGNYLLAKEMFVSVDELWPDYHKTRHFLNLISKRLSDAESLESSEAE